MRPARGGRATVAQRIEFRNTLSLGFPPSEIEGARSFDDDGTHLDTGEARGAALAAGELGHVELTPAFFGLLGGQARCRCITPSRSSRAST